MRGSPFILSWASPTETDRRLAGIAAAMGLTPREAIATASTLADGSLQRDVLDRTGCVLTTCATIHQMLQADMDQDQLRSFLCRSLEFLFVVGFSGHTEDAGVIELLSGGRLGRSVTVSEDGKYQVSTGSAALCGCLAGLNIEPVHASSDSGFIVREDGDDIRHHILVDGKPFFTEVSHGSCRVFLLACTEVADLHDPLKPGDSLRRYFSRVVPELLFLRHVFGARCWHSPEQFGCFIIDDPLLRKQYGFLRFEALVEAMDEHGFAASVAFIPWNFRRTQAATARLFKARSDRLSLCVHGCDHTEGEFGTSDVRSLEKRSLASIERMDRHRDISDVDYDPVMVFPKGVFSLQALRVLKSCGFLAAVNSGIETPSGIAEATLNDLLELPAVQCDGFPLFLRRYPVELSDFALDMILGKPALIVEHHAYFREGPAAAAAFVDRLNGLTAGIRWCGLGEILECCRLERCDGNGTVHVKFYTRRLRLCNASPAPLRYVLHKKESQNIPVKRVLRDGKETPCQRRDGETVIEAVIAAGDTAIFEVEYSVELPDMVAGFKVGERAAAFARRHLSEFRDSRLSRHPRLLRACNRLTQLVLLRGNTANHPPCSEPGSAA